MSETKLKLIELQPLHHVRTYVSNAENPKNHLQKATLRGEIFVRELTDEGDALEESSKISLKDVIGVSIQQKTGICTLYHNGIDADLEDEDDARDEKPIIAFSHWAVTDNGEWIIGKVQRQVNGIDVDNAEYMAFKVSAFKELENNADNYMSSQLDWLMSAVFAEYEEMFPTEDDDDEEFDDGE